VAEPAVFTQFGTDVLTNFDRPSLVQTWSLTAALVTQLLNACRSAGGTMLSRQVTSSLRPDELSNLLTPVFWRQAVASDFALATADDEAMGVDADVAPPFGLLLVLLLLLQPVTTRIPRAATAAGTCHFPGIKNSSLCTLARRRPAGLHGGAVRAGQSAPVCSLNAAIADSSVG
jgi:hypothetical protein